MRQTPIELKYTRIEFALESKDCKQFHFECENRREKWEPRAYPTCHSASSMVPLMYEILIKCCRYPHHITPWRFGCLLFSTFRLGHSDGFPRISPLSGVRRQSLAARKCTCDVLFGFHLSINDFEKCDTAMWVWQWWKWNCISLFFCEKQINFACTHRSHNTRRRKVKLVDRVDRLCHRIGLTEKMVPLNILRALAKL